MLRLRHHKTMQHFTTIELKLQIPADTRDTDKDHLITIYQSNDIKRLIQNAADDIIADRTKIPVTVTATD